MKTTAAEIKLNPVRIRLFKYDHSIMLALEYLAQEKTYPTKIVDDGDYIELILPYTKHSIRPLQRFINKNQ